MTGAGAAPKAKPRSERTDRRGFWLRVIFYTTMGLCLFNGFANALKLYYYVFFTQLFLVLVSIALNLWTYASFSYTQTISSAKAVKGETVHLKIGVYNDKPFTFTLMRVRVIGVSVSKPIELTFSLAPRSDIAFDVPLELPYRGEYHVGMSSLYVQDIFGLCPMRFDMRRLSYYRLLRLRVYPKLHKLPALRSGALDEKHFNALNLTAAPQGDSYAFVRAYQSGDIASRIHWKLSLRGQELFTRQYDIPTQARTLLVLGNSVKSQISESVLFYADTICECAAALARHSLTANHPVEITACGVPGAKAASLRDFPRLYDYLALLPFRQEATGVAEALLPYSERGDAPHCIFVLAGDLDDDLAYTLRKTTGAGRQAVLLLVDSVRIPEPERLAPGVVCHEVKTGCDVAKALEAVLL